MEVSGWTVNSIMANCEAGAVDCTVNKGASVAVAEELNNPQDDRTNVIITERASERINLIILVSFLVWHCMENAEIWFDCILRLFMQAPDHFIIYSIFLV